MGVAFCALQIKTNMEMDSHEERLHNMIQNSKREAAKEEAGRRAKELRERQKEMVRIRPMCTSFTSPCLTCRGRRLIDIT